MNNNTLHLVEIATTYNGQPCSFYALALREQGHWFWYPDPAIQLGDRQEVVRWVQVGGIEGWEGDE